MDEVLADFEGRLRQLWQQKYPSIDLFENGVRDTFYIGADDIGGEHRAQVKQIIATEGFFASLDPLDGAREALLALRDLGHQVYILTSPGVSYPFAAGEKHYWVSKHYGKEMLERLIITPAKHLVRGDLLIDDRPILPFEEEAEWEHVLFDRSYNKSIEGKRRLDWGNWREILTEL